MAGALLIRITHFSLILGLWPLFSVFSLPAEVAAEKIGKAYPESNLVLINFVTRIHGPKNAVEINGKLLADHAPIITQAFSSTGIVLNRKGYIMTYLGYNWLEIGGQETSIEVYSSEGNRWKGKLIGIDQSNGVTVVKIPEGRLKVTPVCNQCVIKDGIKVISPVSRGLEFQPFRESRVISAGAKAGLQDSENWLLNVDKPMPDIGQPILTKDQGVFGYIGNQDPIGTQNMVIPISSLLVSANKIIKKRGDIQIGWLGVFPNNAPDPDGTGIVIEAVEQNSPAQRAGLAMNDFLVSYNGKEVVDARQFIQLVENTPIGSVADIQIIREGNPMTLKAPIEARKLQTSGIKLSFNLPDALGLPGSDISSSGPSINPRFMVGLDTTFITTDLAEALQLPVQYGLLVTDVAKKMPADLAGVLIGDVILSVDGHKIGDPMDFASNFLGHNWRMPILFKVLRKGAERTIPIKIETQEEE